MSVVRPMVTTGVPLTGTATYVTGASTLAAVQPATTFATVAPATNFAAAPATVLSGTAGYSVAASATSTSIAMPRAAAATTIGAPVVSAGRGARNPYGNFSSMVAPQVAPITYTGGSVLSSSGIVGSSSIVMSRPASSSIVGSMVGTQTTTIVAASDVAVMRVVCYKWKADKLEEAKTLIDELEASFDMEKFQGCLDFWGSNSSETNYNIFQVFSSQAMLDRYKTGLKEQFLERMKPLLDGGAIFDYTAPVSLRRVNGAAGAGCVLRSVGYKCLAGKEAEFGAVIRELGGQAAQSPGVVCCHLGQADPQTFVAGMVFASQAALEAYQTWMKDNIGRLLPLLDGGAIFQEIGPVAVGLMIGQPKYSAEKPAAKPDKAKAAKKKKSCC